MRLASFHVNMFRNVLDSTEVQVEEDVTCLVGKNESGKTAMLEALYRLNPVYSERFKVQENYPRWRLVQDRRKKAIDEARPITATFDLQPEDVAAVEALLGPGALNTRRFQVVRTYGAPDSLLAILLDNDAIDHQASTDHFAAALGLSPEAAAVVAGTQTLGELHARATAGATAAADEAAAQREADGETPSVPNPVATALSAELDQAGKAAQDAIDKGGFGGTTAGVLRDRVPKFFYFASYDLLPGRIDLQELMDSAQEQPAASPKQTARSLLRLAQTTPADLMGDEYERRKSELEAVSNDLTSQVLEYWTQNPDLRVVFDVDPEIVQDGYGNQRVARRHLEVRVEDGRHKFTNNFSQRSSGFQWFFSFLAAFTEFEDSNTEVVVLLDEPALSLHGKAQADFVRFLNERLAPVAQVVYTTHSPFLVETDRIDRVRVVEDRGPDEGTVVSADAMMVGDDTLFPLQAALGYDVAQHLFVGNTNLLVEGPSDYLYLDIFSRHLADDGGDGLHPGWRILTAGGSGNIPAFVTLMGRELQVTVLVDSGTEGSGRLQNAIMANRLSQRRLITVSEIIGRKNGDIEDLFTEADYLLLYNTAFGAKIKPADLPPGDRIVKRLGQLTCNGRFDHNEPAYTLLKERTTLLPKMSPDTKAAFQRLVTRINGTCDQP